MMTRPARARACLLLAAALLAGGCARPATTATPQPRAFDFARVADSIIATPPLDRAHLGIMVYDPASRTVLYEHNADRRFVPASNQKYWPTATALHVFGSEFRYRTPVLAADLDAATGTTRGIVVVGTGDPTLSARFHAGDHAALEMLADSIRAAGVRRIAGDLVIDASRFDRAVIPGTWTFGNLNSTSAPGTAAFAVAEGLFRVTIEPAATAGEPAAVRVEAPAGIVPLLHSVVTTPAGSTAGTSIARGPWDDTLRIAGGIPAGAETRTLRVPMTEPARFAGHVLADALRARGITLEGAVRVMHDSVPVAALRTTTIATWTSPPMRDIVAAILMPSQNWITEQLVRTLGAEAAAEGSWRAGIDVQNAFLFDVVGIDSAALRLQDGSGMSHQNLVTPRAVVQLLDHARTASWRDDFRAGLARPARPGTLTNRLRHLEGRLAGKTGTLSNVNALSGYVTTRDGRELIFVVFSNASGLPGATVVAAIDHLVSVLADGADAVARLNVPQQGQQGQQAGAAEAQAAAVAAASGAPAGWQEVPHALPPGTITDWRVSPPGGFPADANRRNLPLGAAFAFHDLAITVDAIDPTSQPATARVRLQRGTATELRTVAAGSAFNWNGYHVAVIAIPRPGELGGGLVALEVATLASLPDAVASSIVAGGAELRLRVPHRITHVTLHHTGNPEPLRPGEDPRVRLRNLQAWGASDRNWWDVPYHFLIDLEGRVYEGRDWRYKGDTNTTYEPAGHFLISVIGNYEVQEPTPAQVDAIADLMAWAIHRFDLPLERIGGHHDYATTSCPGPFFRALLEDGTFHDLVRERLARR
jgi:serine-type D-Ala-D-Ala carboxypeptidase/endopeptidase (penicillin-binding protein 4)